MLTPIKTAPKVSQHCCMKLGFPKKTKQRSMCPSVFQTTHIIDTSNEAVLSWAQLFATDPTRLNCFRASRSVPMQRHHPAGHPAPRARLQTRSLDPLVEVMLEFPRPSGCGPETFHFIWINVGGRGSSAALIYTTAHIQSCKSPSIQTSWGHFYPPLTGYKLVWIIRQLCYEANVLLLVQPPPWLHSHRKRTTAVFVPVLVRNSV